MNIFKVQADESTKDNIIIRILTWSALDAFQYNIISNFKENHNINPTNQWFHLMGKWKKEKK